MKKVLLFLVIFALIAVMATYVLIVAKTYTPDETNIEENASIDNSNNSNLKTVDLYGTFSTNGIETTEKTINTSRFKDQIKIIQISGLKDKKVEQKINSNIEKEVLKAVDKLDKNITDEFTDSLIVNSYVEGNFSNVLSISIYCEYKVLKEETPKENEEEYYNEDNENYDYKYYSCGLNYNLVNGDKLKIEDLFANESDVETVVRIALYKYWEEQDNNEFGEDSYYDVYYDYDKNMWMGTHSSYSEENEEWVDEIVEFVPKMTENDINKGIKRFLKTDNNFNFSPNRLNLKIENINEYYNTFSISMADIADKLVIYDKFLTDNSIYENDDLRVMSLITCTAEDDYSLYKESKYESDNLFYDIDFHTDYEYNHYPYMEYYNTLKEELYGKSKEKLEEYKSLAKENPDKAYFVFINFSVDCGMDEWNGSKYNNLISTNIGVKTIECDYSDKQIVLDEVLNHYRYYLIGYYRTIYNHLGRELYDDSYENKVADVDEKIETHVYNVMTQEEINSVGEIFIDGVDYKQVLIDKMFEKWGDYDYFLNEYNPNQMDFDLNVDRISIRFNGEDEYGYGIDFSEIDNYLNLEKIVVYILPSDERTLYDYDINNLSLDELNLAFNEIFARHGHDFKVEKYKEYFSSKDWYKPIAGKTVTMDELTEIERENAKFLRNEISNRETYDY